MRMIGLIYIAFAAHGLDKLQWFVCFAGVLDGPINPTRRMAVSSNECTILQPAYLSDEYWSGFL